MKNDWPDRLERAIANRFDEMVTLRRHLHTNPEPSGQEFETSLHLYQLLGDLGFLVRMGPEGRGVLADAVANGEGSRIAFRADIDALRIQDRKQVPYRSQRAGIMHACGHDAHTAVVYGALLAIQDLAQEGGLPWPVPLRAIFQPAEETATGAREMIGAGALDRIEAILATHVDPTRPVGQIGLRWGVLTAHCDVMCMTVQGRGGHAARPHESNDPIAAAAQLISTLYLFIPRATDSQDAVVVTIGQFEGGDNPNVIPEQVALRGTLRTLDGAVRERTIQHIRQLARGIEEISGTTIDIKFESGVHAVHNDTQLADLVGRAVRETLGENQPEKLSRPSMGSEDFAEYLDHVPGVMFRLGSAAPSQSSPGLHTPMFDIDEHALAIGARVMARTAVLWFDPARRHDGAGAATSNGTRKQT